MAKFSVLVFVCVLVYVACVAGQKNNGSNDTISLIPENVEALYNLTENLISDKPKYDDLDTWVAPEEIRKNYPYYLSGYDEDGRPIWVAELGRWNLRKIVEAGGQQFKDFDKFARQGAEKVVKSLSDRSTEENPITEAILIADYADLSIVQLAHVPTLTYVLNMAREYQYLIERHIYVGLVLNANYVAERFLNLIKPIFGTIMEKIEIYGNNKSRFIPHVLKYCPRDQIPEWYGGLPGFKPVEVHG